MPEESVGVEHGFNYDGASFIISEFGAKPFKTKVDLLNALLQGEV